MIQASSCNRESNYGGMTPHAVALLIRADPSFKYVSAARQGLKRGGTCGRACKRSCHVIDWLHTICDARG